MAFGKVGGEGGGGPCSVDFMENEGARGLAHSKTLARGSTALKYGEAFGVGQSSGALERLLQLQLLQNRAEVFPDVFGHDFVALDRGVDAIGQVQFRTAADALEEKRN